MVKKRSKGLEFGEMANLDIGNSTMKFIFEIDKNFINYAYIVT